MMPHFLLTLTSLATILASPVCATGVYKPPKAQSFVTVDLWVGLPSNVTTHDGPIAVIPLPSGTVQGKFNGNLTNGLSYTERVLPGSTGPKSEVGSNWIFQNSNKERILVQLTGLTSYASENLHGLGYATMKTDVPAWEWVNWATFLIEWEGSFNTGRAKFEFFHITTGGRRDGKPIPGLGGSNSTA